MCLRIIALTILPGLFLAVNPVTPRMGNEDRPPPPPTRAAAPPRELGPPRIDAERAATLSEKEILSYLATPETTEDETIPLLEALCRFDRSPAAVEALIYWLEFQDYSKLPKVGPGDYIFKVGLIEYPAKESLERIGVFAVPQLVDEYVCFFDNTSLAAHRTRHRHLAADQKFRVLDVQSPRSRLSKIELVLIATPEVAGRAVECAWDRMEAEPDNDHVQRACRELSRLTEQFHRDDLERLFQVLNFARPDRAALVPLLDEWLPVAERAERIAGLTRFGTSPVVVSQLIQWLEFRPPPKGAAQRRDIRVQIGADGDRPHALSAYPAAVALAEIGPSAAPRLVDEYVYYFENTNYDANRRRQYARLDCHKTRDGKDTGSPLEVQSPAHLLSLVVMVLSQKPETAQSAVQLALRRMEATPSKDRAHRACKELIGRIVAQFPAAERGKLFPPDDLPKK